MSEITQRITQTTTLLSEKSFAIEKDSDQEFIRSLIQQAGEYLEAGDFKEAERCLNVGLQRIPDHPRCLAYLAVCAAMDQRKIPVAEKLARRIIADNPGDPTAHFALGRVQLVKGKRRSAFAHFAKARRLAAGDWQIEGELDRVEPRKPPVLRFLSRNHPLNVALGKLRASLKRFGKR